MNNMSEVSIIMSFSAGLLTFLSPCILPLLPSYIAYITGKSFEELKGSKEDISLSIKKLTIAHSLFFILGFSVVFILLGVIVSYFGNLFGIKKIWLEKAGGVLIIIFALNILGLFKINFLNTEKRLTFHKKKVNFFSSFLIGAVFSLGWTPCVGPILSSILIYATTVQSMPRAIILLVFYSIGIGIPFLIMSVLMNQFISLFNRFKVAMKAIPIITGVFLIFIGVLLFLGRFQELSNFFNIGF